MKHSLFRSIRHKLLNEGKLLRYLSYAVGEVVLIIVGILMALKINDWNEDRKEQVEFDAYLVQLREDVKVAISRAERVAGFTKEASPQNYSIIQFLDDNPGNDPDLEAFEEALISIDRWTPTNIHVGQLGRLLSGDVEIISRNPHLANQALELQGRIGGVLTIINERRENRLTYTEITSRYITKPYTLVPEVKLSYDLERMRTSEEFLHAVYNLSHNKHMYNRFLNGIIEELADFLAILEEYE